MKRGSTDLSLVVGVDKPSGMTSHDVINRVRSIFGEKRVGHAGTLDPLASGVLPVLIGPATRLSDHLMGHDKTYRVSIKFGQGTTTDDMDGEVIRVGAIPPKLADFEFANDYLEGLIGRQSQLPPSYSAIKVNGQKAYEQARRGNVIKLEPREIEIYSALLVDISSTDDDAVIWTVDFKVSKGTYIRSIARDIGFALDCPAHVSALRRLNVGSLEVDDCVSIETLSEVGVKAALDPVSLLGYKFTFIDDDLRKALTNGQPIQIDKLSFHRYENARRDICACTSGVMCATPPEASGEKISMICDNALKAIYAYNADKLQIEPVAIFQRGVKRGHAV